jgi:hypothetical protein
MITSQVRKLRRAQPGYQYTPLLFLLDEISVTLVQRRDQQRLKLLHDLLGPFADLNAAYVVASCQISTRLKKFGRSTSVFTEKRTAPLVCFASSAR